MSTPAPKKIKPPLDHAMRQMHDAMETVFAYDRDPNFVPRADQLVLFELLQKQVTGYVAMLIIVVETMRERASCAVSAAPPPAPPHSAD